MDKFLNSIEIILNKEIFWSALSSIATFLACLIALWQTKYSNRKVIKLKLYTNAYLLKGTCQIRYISIEIINIGNRKVIINEWSYFTHSKSERIKLFTEMDSIVPIKMPQTIEIENKLDLYFEYSFFVNSLKKLLEQNKLKENQKIIFCVKDSTGKTYKIKTKETVKQFIESMEPNNATM